MRCYTTNTTRLLEAATIASGIEVEHDPALGFTLRLGELGNNRRLVKIKCDGKAPPPIIAAENIDEGHPVRGLVHHAAVSSYVVRGNCEHHALISGHVTEGTNILCRISTAGRYCRDDIGVAMPYWGNPQLIVAGQGAYGAAGRVGRWQDGLWSLAPHEAVLVTPCGVGRKMPLFVAYHAGVGLAPMTLSLGQFFADVLPSLIDEIPSDTLPDRSRMATACGHGSLALILDAAIADRAGSEAVQ